MAEGQLQTTYKLVDLPTGVKVYTERWHHAGIDLPTETIVCVHGLGSTSTTFFPFIKPLLTLLPTAHILLYDWACSGSSPLSLAHVTRTVSDLVADLDALVTAQVPTGRLSIVAHSAGTLLATRWLGAQAAPSALARVSHVVFTGGPLNPPVASALTDMQESMAAVVAAGRPLVVGMLRAITLAQGAAGYAAAIRAFARDLADGPEGESGGKVDWEAVRRRARVLVVNGEEDGMLAGWTSQASCMDRLTLTLEAPEEFAQIVAEFLNDS
ncbi:Alpha/Beta hydrolase protein [Daedaleopsis nitida]|nr:Alpha/Beta hydrolase protein [Daedaleopsis nitida]